MGNGEWGMGSGEWGDKGDGGDEPMPNAQNPENHTFKDGLQSR
ncbi:hypothetical protein [Nostoc sp.]